MGQEETLTRVGPRIRGLASQVVLAVGDELPLRHEVQALVKVDIRGVLRTVGLRLR